MAIAALTALAAASLGMGGRALAEEERSISGVLEVRGAEIPGGPPARVTWTYEVTGGLLFTLRQRVHVYPSGPTPEGCDSVAVSVEVDVTAGRSRLGVLRRTFSPVGFGDDFRYTSKDSNEFDGDDVDGASDEEVKEALREGHLDFSNLRVDLDSSWCKRASARQDEEEAVPGGASSEGEDEGGDGDDGGDADERADEGGGGESGSSRRDEAGGEQPERRCALQALRVDLPNQVNVWRCPDCSTARVPLTRGRRETTSAERKASLRRQCGLEREGGRRERAGDPDAGEAGRGETSDDDPGREAGDAGSGARDSGADTGARDTEDDAADLTYDPPETLEEIEEREEEMNRELERALDAGIDSEALAEALSDESPAVQALYLAELGLSMFAIATIGGDEAEEEGRYALDPDVKPYGIGQIALPIAVGVGSAGFLFISGIQNGDTYDDLLAEAEGWTAELEKECQGGDSASCRRLVTLHQQMTDLASSAGNRELSSVLFGLGSFTGVPFEGRVAAGVSRDGFHAASVGPEGIDLASRGLTGGVLEAVIRTSFVRMGVSYNQRYGDLIADDQLAPDRIRHTPKQGIHSLGLGLGVQLGQGLLSPYAEARMRYSDLSGETEVAIDPYYDDLDDHEPSEPEKTDFAGASGTDTALVVGNTFNFGGLFSSKGPLVRTLALDLAYVHPLGISNFDPGWQAKIGYSVSWPFDFSEYRDRPTPAEDPDQSVTAVMAYAFPLGMGIEIGRHILDGPISYMNGWVGFANGEIDTAGGWGLGGTGRWFFGPRGSHEIGWTVGLLGLMYFKQYRSFTEGPGDVQPDGRVSQTGLGFLPARVHYRSYHSGFPIETGLMGPLFWTIGDTSEFDDDEFPSDIYGGTPPVLWYAGIGF